MRLIYYFTFKIDVIPSGDEPEYLTIANNFFVTNILSLKDYIIRRAPLASIVLAPFLQLFGNHENIARLANVLISSTIPPTLFFIVKTQFNYNKKESIIIALIYSLYPPAIFYSSMIQSETLAALLMLICFYHLIKFKNDNKFKNAMILGISFGLLSLTRSSNYYLIFILIPIIYYLEKQRK